MSAHSLPPGQQATTKFPAIGERDPEPFDAATWRLEVGGLVERPLSLSFAEFSALPHVIRTGTIHCVTTWSRPDTTFRGVGLSTLLEAARPHADAQFVRFASGRGHDTSLPLDVAAADVLVADGLGQGSATFAIPPEHGGPVRTVTFARYFYKSVKWVRAIELLAEDRLGFWERTSGYHNRADPWREERYVVRDVDRAELRRMLAARDLSGRDLLGADLRGIDLSGARLRGALLRNTVFAGANLRGADLTGANLTNADLRRADLSGAVLEGVDLDGADLRGADLRGSSGTPASLAVTRFVSIDAGASDGAAMAGVDWTRANVDALLPEQVTYLRAAGARLPALGARQRQRPG